jgi:hypothetical protein
MPEANDHTVGVMELMAKTEREAFSRRTKEALAVAKAHGVGLSNLSGAKSLRRAVKGGAELWATESANAMSFSADLLCLLEDFRAAGYTSLSAIAAEHASRGIRTQRGGLWGIGIVKTQLCSPAGWG